MLSSGEALLAGGRRLNVGRMPAKPPLTGAAGSDAKKTKKSGAAPTGQLHFFDNI